MVLYESENNISSLINHSRGLQIEFLTTENNALAINVLVIVLLAKLNRVVVVLCHRGCNKSRCDFPRKHDFKWQVSTSEVSVEVDPSQKPDVLISLGYCIEDDDFSGRRGKF